MYYLLNIVYICNSMFIQCSFLVSAIDTNHGHLFCFECNDYKYDDDFDKVAKKHQITASCRRGKFLLLYWNLCLVFYNKVNIIKNILCGRDFDPVLPCTLVEVKSILLILLIVLYNFRNNMAFKNIKLYNFVKNFSEYLYADVKSALI